MKPRHLLVIAAAAGALTACATPTVYGPATSRSSAGYLERRIETDRFQVTFRGGNGAPAAQVADYALLRAAELTLREGYDWFRIVDRETDVRGEGGGPRVSVGGGGASFGRHSSLGLGVGVGFDLSGGPAMSRTLEVLLGRGAAPREPSVFDARDVVRHIGPRAHGPDAG